MPSKYLKTIPERLPSIINRINDGEIKIPAFQREFVWEQEQVFYLLDSINKGYPIGSVLLWLTGKRLNFTREIAGYHYLKSLNNTLSIMY